MLLFSVAKYENQEGNLIRVQQDTESGGELLSTSMRLTHVTDLCFQNFAAREFLRETGPDTLVSSEQHSCRDYVKEII